MQISLRETAKRLAIALKGKQRNNVKGVLKINFPMFSDSEIEKIMQEAWTPTT